MNLHHEHSSFRILTQENKNEILKKRADKLALRCTPEDTQTDMLKIVEFKLAKETYAIESIYIREVYPFKDLTKLPGAPPFVHGLINVRRKIISVIDLRLLFELPIDANLVPNKAILLESDDMEFAVLVEAVLGVRSVNFMNLQTSLPTLTGVKEEFLKGITVDGTIVLDGNKLLTDKKMIVQDTVEV